MSYARDGFDPTATELKHHEGLHIDHLHLQGLGVHIVDAAKIIKLSASRQVQLVDADLTGGHTYSNSGNVRLAASVGPHVSDGLPVRYYQGNLTLDELGDMTHFADHASHDDFGDVDIRQYGKRPNKLLITDAAGAFTTMLAYKRRKMLIHMANEFIPKNGGNPEDFVYAPANKKVDNKKAQLVHFLNSLIIGSHLGNNICSGGVRPLEAQELIITPEGPLYKHPVSGEYVHNLRREVVVMSAKKEAKQSPPKTKNNTPPELPSIKPKESLDDLYGIDTIKQALRPLIAYYRHPDIMKQWNIDRPPSGVLIKGPAGTGKTTIIKALAHELGASLVIVGTSDVSVPFIGESEAALQRIFNQVRDASEPTILFFDELDASISSNNKGSDSGAHKENALAAIFKKETAEIAATNPNVILAAATNFPERIHEGLIRAGRFDLVLTVGLPDEATRTQIWRNMIIQDSVAKMMADQPDLSPDEVTSPADTGQPQPAELPLFTGDILDDATIQELVRLTDGLTGADIKNTLRQTKLQKALQQIETGHAAPISVHDLRQQLIAQQRA